MPDPLTSQLAHLYRRAAFGATADQLAVLATLGYGGAVDRLLDRSAPDVAADAVVAPVLASQYGEVQTVQDRALRRQLRQDGRRAITTWWLERMVLSEAPLREKLTWFWHGHFATSIDKVQLAGLMFRQNVTMRELGAANFETLTQALAKDGAMMVWLDSNSNARGRPNENFARELMELFTIGIGNYSDADVREAARAFTGWKFNRSSDAASAFHVNPNQADPGVKNLIGSTAVTGEQVVTLLTRHPAGARFVAARVWSQFAWPVKPDDPVIDDLAPGFAAGLDVTSLLRSVFMHPRFQSAAARQGLVKQPVEYVVGTLRALGLRPGALPWTQVGGILGALNQEPFAPPSVGGWPQNGYWVSTATSLARLRFAQTLSGAAPLEWLSGVPGPGRPEALARRLGLDGWTAATLSALAVASTPRNQLVAALVSPEYVLN